MTHPLRATIQWLCRMAEWLAIVALIAATGLIMLQIVAREIFVSGVSWADELARFAGLAVIFLGVPALLMRDEHVKVDTFINMMPERARRFFVIANDLLMVLFCGLFVYAGYLFLLRASRFSTPALGVPNLIWYMPAIVGMSLMLLVAIDRAVSALVSGPKDDPAS
jgi:TRAP-type C4-dicarboxylate transport system permease small subunit